MARKRTTQEVVLAVTISAVIVVLIVVGFSKCSVHDIFTRTLIKGNINQKSTESAISLPPFLQEYEKYNYNVQHQLFFGTWKVVRLVPADIALPSSYSRTDESGKLRLDTMSIIGQTIEFRQDHVRFSGESHPYVAGPTTYTLALSSGDDTIGHYYAKTLGFNEGCFSTVLYVIPENYLATTPSPQPHPVVHVFDFNQLYLLDNTTIYASNGDLVYELQRVGS